MAVPRAFADFCCDLLSSLGSCNARRMFGGWGISLDGLTVAIVTDLGSGQTLWLKADEGTRQRFEAAGCARFSYGMRQGENIVERSMNYYSAPEEAMDSVQAMAPWARLALQAALSARSLKQPAGAAAKARGRRTAPARPRSTGKRGAANQG